MRNKIAVIGATGNVGRQIVSLLLQKNIANPDCLLLFASPKSKGKILSFGSHRYTIHSTSDCPFEDCPLALFATDSDISKHYVPTALSAGCTVIDSSSAFRLDPNVPLIVPPVNAHLISTERTLYATSNCIASPLSIILSPLHDAFRARRVLVSTYQSASGAGKEPMDELYEHAKLALKNAEYLSSKHFPRQLAFNVIPQVGSILEDGFSTEEEKIISEVKKIVSPTIQLAATAVRVAVGIGHSLSVSLEFENPFTLEEALRTLASAPGIALSQNHYSTPLETAGQDLVLVGRVRRDPTVENGLCLWSVSDNLRRGAALDAVEIAEELLKKIEAEALLYTSCLKNPHFGCAKDDKFHGA